MATTKITVDKMDCLTCDTLGHLTGVGGDFVGKVSDKLADPINEMFIALAFVWFVWTGYKLLFKQEYLANILPELFLLVISGALIGTNWDGLVRPAYEASLAVMGGAAQTAFAVVGTKPAAGYSGMPALMVSVEVAIKNIFIMTVALLRGAAWNDWTPLFYAIVLILPYLLLFFMYFSQVLVATFRVMLVALFSPFLIMAFGFPWGRPTAVAGLRALLSAVMVLFAASAAVSFALYGVDSLGLDEIEGSKQVAELASFDNPKFLVVILLGWLGFSLMLTGTEIANSIMGSMLTNAAAGMLTAGMTGTAMAAAKVLNPFTAGSRILGAAGAVKGQGEAWQTIGRGAKAAYAAAKQSEILAKFRGGGSG